MPAVLITICLLLTGYIILLQRQLKRMNHLLKERIVNESGQIISIELVNQQLTMLAANMNRCLKQEEQLRLQVTSDEEDFKNLIVNISHDLRTPLTAIQGYLQLLSRSTLSNKQQDQLMVARKHCDELGHLIEHFYEYSYLINSKPNVELVKLNLTDLIVENLIAMHPVFQEHQLNVTMEEKTFWVQADLEMTTRIIQNLLRNCIAHAAGDIIIRITKDDSTVLHVINEIPEHINLDVSRLFERFYVADSSRKTTGLGLAIVKLLAEQMGARVGADLNGKLLDIWVQWMN